MQSTITKAVVTVGVFTCGRKVVEYLEWYDKNGLVDKLPTSAIDEEPDLFDLKEDSLEVKFKHYNHPKEVFSTFLSEKDQNSIQYSAYVNAGNNNVYHYGRLPITQNI